MIFLFFNLIAFLILIISIRNISLGYSLCVASFFAVPLDVRVGVSNMSMAFSSFLSMSLLLLCCIKKGNYKSIFSNNFAKITLVWLLITSIIGLIPGEAGISFSVKAIYYLVRDFFFIIAGLSVFSDKVQIGKFYKYIFIELLVVCIYGIFEYILGTNPYIDLITSSFGTHEGVVDIYKNDVRGFINGRVQGFSWHPLTHGQLMQVGLFLVLVWKNKIKREIYFFLVCLLLINILLCGSRSALLATLLFFLFSFPSKTRISVLKISFLVAIFIFFIIGEEKRIEIIDTLKSLIFFWDEDVSNSIKGSSLQMRLGQLELAYSEVKSNLLFGHGIGYVVELQSTFDVTGGLYGYESIFLYKVTEIGLAGFFVYIVWYYKAYRIIYNSVKGIKDINSNGVKYLFYAYFVNLMMTGDMSTQTIVFASVIPILSYGNIKNKKTES